MTKKLSDLEDALHATPLNKDQLEQLKDTLQEKLDKLRNLSEDILAQLQDEAKIAAGINPDIRHPETATLERSHAHSVM